jgi:hypothetical protein
MFDAFPTPSRQWAAVNTILGAITDPVQYWLNVSIAATPGTDPAAPPAISLCSWVLAATLMDLDAGSDAA